MVEQQLKKKRGKHETNYHHYYCCPGWSILGDPTDPIRPPAYHPPPVVSEPKWDSPQTWEFAHRACFDCHSNEVVWPWYSNIAPVSWLVQHDVDEGRQYLNFSDWVRVREAHEILEVMQEGDMPPSIYLIMHPNAKIDQAEKDAFISGMQVTIRGQYTSFQKRRFLNEHFFSIVERTYLDADDFSIGKTGCNLLV